MEMRFTKAFTAGAVAISMASTPILAQPSAAPLSVAGSVERSGAAIDGHSGALRGSNLYVSAAVVLALILAAILIPELTKPNSP
jgi:hypothetical protein